MFNKQSFTVWEPFH